MAEEVAPQLGLDSFSCPHCGAHAHQFWFNVYPERLKEGKLMVYTLDDIKRYAAMGIDDERDKKEREELLARFKKNEVTYDISAHMAGRRLEMMNMQMSRCYACEGFSVWIKGKLIWPSYTTKVEPHPDIPGAIKDDFIEAASIVEMSPRGSAALSRMIIQKLLGELGEKGDNINEDIGSLVKKGLEVEIQRALDVVRVVGNNAVHPGKIDLKDDAGIALALLQLINLVVERRISTQKRIDEMFANLPAGAREQIEKRDGVVLRTLTEDEPTPNSGS